MSTSDRLLTLTELADKEGLSSIGSPFSVLYVAIAMYRETKSFVTPAKLIQAAFMIIQRLDPFFG